MGITRRAFIAAASVGAAGMALTMSGCSSSSSTGETTSGSQKNSAGSSSVPTGSLAFNNAAWNYDADNDVFWQVGVVYCEHPATTEYESLGIYVPGAYFNGTENGDGTYTCSVNETGSEGNWTAQSAPIVIPVNTAGYSAQAAPTNYSFGSVSDYLKAGLIYVFAGCRGRDNGYANDGSLAYSGGAPWAITDLKAAIRYLRYNNAILPGNKEAIFTFGHSGGGAQSALVGATGDSELYLPYLENIGAAIKDDDGAALSDAIAGAMCWCPITCLDQADAAYEWMMGQYASTGTRAAGTWTAAMSEDLSGAFAEYINGLGLKNNGTTLKLEASEENIFAAGSYYDYLRNVIEESLNNFLADTEFPYTPSNSTMADGGFGAGMGPDSQGSGGPGGDMGGGDMPGGDMGGGGTPGGDMGGGEPGGGNMPGGETGGTGGAGGGEAGGAGSAGGGEPGGDTAGGNTPDGSNRSDESSAANTTGVGGTSSNARVFVASFPSGDAPSVNPPDNSNGMSTGSGTTYQTAQDYIDSLNTSENWVTYNEATNTATVTSVGAFSRMCKIPSKSVGAFDATDRSQAENKVFGNDENDALHFDATMTRLLQENADTYAALSNWDNTLPEAYAQDREQTDALETDMDTRVGMYNPLYYLNSYYEGAGTSNVAPHWRIRTGIEQTDTSLTVETNLALALQACNEVNDVDFATVWGQGHTTAERSGSSTANFIEWVEDCAQ